MAKKRGTSLISGAVALALGTAAITVPVAANAETKTNLNQPLACNLQLKNPGGIPFGAASGVEGVYNAGNKTYDNFQISLAKTEAPDTVEQGQEFDYVIDAGTVGVPAQIKAAVTANVSRVSQMNIWYELPDNAEYVSHTQQGGPEDIKVEKVGNKLRIWIPEPTKNSKDVTKWTKTSKADYVHGGAEATKAGSYFNITLPKVTVKLKATGAPGSTIQAGFPKADADKFGSDLPIQFYADASAKFGVTINANGFIRCGLSEDDTYWPREKNGTNLNSTKFSAVKIVAPAKKSDAEINDPKAKAPVTITEGDALPKAEEQITDFAKLPAGTTAKWATEHKTVGENQQGKITVTYPDNTTDTVNITVNVKKKATQADLNDPKAVGPVTITQGDALPEAKAQIADFAKLPAGTTAAWASKHETVGDNQNGTITVTYPDKTTDTVNLAVNVKEQYVPQAKSNPTTVQVGADIANDSAKAQIGNAASAPEGTTFAWKTKPDTTSAAEGVEGVVTVTVPGKEPVDVAVKYNVQAEPVTWMPEVDENVQEVEVGAEVKAAEEYVTNKGEAPAGTTYEWAENGKPDTSTAGEKTGTITVTVGDKVYERTVKFNVAAVYAPTAKDEATDVQIGSELTDAQAKEAIANASDAPFGTTFEWVEKPKTDTVGATTGKVKVTVEGKDPVEVQVKLNVVTDYVPAAKDTATEVEQNATIADEEAKAQIANADTAPAGTTFAWKTKPDTTTAGEKTGVVTVTVPGGEAKDVEVKYTVKEKTAENPNPEQPNPENPNPEQPNPEQPNPENPQPQGDRKVVVKGAKAGDTVRVQGNSDVITADEEGKFEVPASWIPEDGKFDVVVTDKDGKETTFTVDVDKGTATKKLNSKEIATAVGGSLASVALMIASFLPIPGLKEMTTNVQKQLGIFNPQLAGAADRALPFVGTILGIVGLGLSIGTAVGKVKVEVLNSDDTRATATGSSK